jgi:hypothetical protein
MASSDQAKCVKKLSTEDKARIVSWREEGVSAMVIADHLGRCRSSIKWLLAKPRALPPHAIPERKKCSGRPAIITSRDREILERFVKKNPRATAGNIKEQLPEVAAVSVKHINWLIVNKVKIRSRIAAQKPLLTDKMKAKRLAFAKKYVGWTEEDWSQVMFSDASTFRCIRANRI